MPGFSQLVTVVSGGPLRVLPTRGSRVVGEASEVSTVSRDGVKPTGGGTVFGGFGVNAHGDDRFLTSNLAGGSVQVFDQHTNAVTRTVASSSSKYQTPGSIGAGPGMLKREVPGCVTRGGSRLPGWERRRTRERSARCSFRYIGS